MKKPGKTVLPLLTASALTTAAHADAIALNPVEMAGYLVWESLPAILVAAVVVVCLFLLLKFRKKK